jgi:photosystem I P700 chlorophyll a apoprotein A1
MVAIGRTSDIFQDSSLTLVPVFAIVTEQVFSWTNGVEAVEHKIISLNGELGTGDFMVHHIHAFTLHVSVLVLIKGCSS